MAFARHTYEMGGMPSKQKKSRRESWKGWRFLCVSLGVTTLSIIFFFASRQIFPTIRESAQQSIDFVTQRINSWGGIRLKSITLRVEPEGAHPLLVAGLRKRLDTYQGQSFWGLDLDQLKRDITQEGWVDDVVVRRVFPDALRVHAIAKQPRFLVKGITRWNLVDAKGSVVWFSREIPGSWVHLPVVMGREAHFERGKTVDEMNRRLEDFQAEFSQLSVLVDTLEAKLGKDIDQVVIQDDSWIGQPLVKLNVDRYVITLPLYGWRDRLESLQFILSDLSIKNQFSAEVLGQFNGRWIVSSKKEEDYGKRVSNSRSH